MTSPPPTAMSLGLALPPGPWEVIYPRVHGMPKAQEEVPQKYVDDYEEACAVLPLSPKCAALLARRILQALLLDPAAGNVGTIKSDNLYKQIDRVKNLPEPNMGIVLQVEEKDARFTLETIYDLFDHYFVKPAKAASRKAQWNTDKQIPAGKPPIK